MWTEECDECGAWLPVTVLEFPDDGGCICAPCFLFGYFLEARRPEPWVVAFIESRLGPMEAQ